MAQKKKYTLLLAWTGPRALLHSDAVMLGCNGGVQYRRDRNYFGAVNVSVHGQPIPIHAYAM